SVSLWSRRRRAMQHVQADEVEVNLICGQAHPLEPLEHGVTRLAGAVVGVRPGEERHGFPYPSILVSDYELEQVRRRLALDARHPDTVGAHGIQAQRSKVRNGIRHEVIARIGNLVDQMLL